MFPLVPLLGLTGLFGGAGILVWYARLSKQEKAKADRTAEDYASDLFGKAMVEECRRDRRVVGITAAMPGGTSSLIQVSTRFPSPGPPRSAERSPATSFSPEPSPWTASSTATRPCAWFPPPSLVYGASSLASACSSTPSSGSYSSGDASASSSTFNCMTIAQAGACTFALLGAFWTSLTHLLEQRQKRSGRPQNPTNSVPLIIQAEKVEAGRDPAPVNRVHECLLL